MFLGIVGCFCRMDRDRGKDILVIFLLGLLQFIRGLSQIFHPIQGSID